MQVALALKQLGWKNARIMINGVRRWRWFKDGKVGALQLF
jgi:hypothetical protein